MTTTATYWILEHACRTRLAGCDFEPLWVHSPSLTMPTEQAAADKAAEIEASFAADADATTEHRFTIRRVG